jgi:transposase
MKAMGTFIILINADCRKHLLFPPSLPPSPTSWKNSAANLRCSHADLAKRLDLLIGVPGIGERTVLALRIRGPELGTPSREQVAALAGFAPFDDDSGKRKGSRHIAGGRDRVRESLYAAALPAAFKLNQALVALYGRLKAAGKPHKLALVACARKLLIFANTVLARQTPWTEKKAKSPRTNGCCVWRRVRREAWRGARRDVR